MEIKGFKVWVIVLSAILALALLIGGNFYYKKLNIEQPLFKLYENIKEVKEFDVNEKGQKIEVTLTLNKTENLQKTYLQIHEETTKIIDQKELILVVKDNRSEKLEDIYSDGQLIIYEALFKGNFSEMATKLEFIAEERSAEAKIYMDNTNIFIQIKDGENYLYEVIEWQKFKKSAVGIGSDKNA